VGRDKSKYLYLTIGLRKDSEGLGWLLEDAREHHMEDQLAKLVAIRLTEHYAMLSGRGKVIPRSLVTLLREPSPETGARDESGEGEETRAEVPLLVAEEPAASEERKRSESGMIPYGAESIGATDQSLSIWAM
jgi:hypothetical protein